MKKLLGFLMLFVTTLVFSQDYNKMKIVAYAKSGESYTPIDGFIMVNLPSDGDLSSVVKMHFCTTYFHYDLGILSKNITEESTDDLEKSTIRTFMLKDYNDSNTKVFDMNFIEWIYPNKMKLYYSLDVNGVRYHFKVSKKEYYEKGVLVESVDYVTD